MKKNTAWFRVIIPVVFASLTAMVACGSDDSGGSGGSSGSTGNKLNSGSACTQNDQCYGGLCLTDETFAELTENGAEAEIPGGYCSKLVCKHKNEAEQDCGPGAFCFDLEQFVESPLTACFQTCESDTDCRNGEGYICTDVSGTTWEPLPRKACLPPSLLCLLEVPQPSCPDVGPDGGAGGAAGSGGAGGSAGASGAAGSRPDAG